VESSERVQNNVNNNLGLDIRTSPTVLFPNLELFEYQASREIRHPESAIERNFRNGVHVQALAVILWLSSLIALSKTRVTSNFNTRHCHSPSHTNPFIYKANNTFETSEFDKCLRRRLATGEPELAVCKA
jgi:hypothetical protein